MSNTRKNLLDLLQYPNAELLFNAYGLTNSDFAGFCGKYENQISALKKWSPRRRPDWYYKELIDYLQAESQRYENAPAESKEVQEYIDALLNLTDYIIAKLREEKPSLRHRIKKRTRAMSEVE